MKGRWEKGHIPHNKGKSKYGDNLEPAERSRRRGKVMYMKHRDNILSRSKEKYHKNPEKYKQPPEKQKSYKQRIRLDILSHYSNGKPKCNCCGEENIKFLSIDHINNDGKKDREEVGGTYSFLLWIRRNKYPNGLQILCMNCNWGRSKEPDKVCPHKKVVYN